MNSPVFAKKLDHITTLGVNAIWLMPIHPIGTINSVNSPYSVRDYTVVGSEYGYQALGVSWLLGA